MSKHCLQCEIYGITACRLLHIIFHATVVAKLSYASPAWWGYASAYDKARLEAFLRRYSKLGFRADTALTLDSICADTDDKLCRNVILMIYFTIIYLLRVTIINRNCNRN